MHGDWYSEQIEFGTPHPACQQMVMGREGGIAIIVAVDFCAWMHT